MSSSSKSNQPEPEEQTRDWLDLPSDVTLNILHRIGVFDILENAQKVCTSWRKVCKEPAMWRVINVKFTWDPRPIVKMCKNAVDRSQGQLVDITLVDFGGGLLEYVADRSSQLKRLEISGRYDTMNGMCTEALKKFPLLEELSLYSTIISKEAIETVGRCCPMLKSLKVNQEANERHITCNEIAIAIGENLHELRHLELIGNTLSNSGLEVILDGCCHLESLDLRRCVYIDLNGEIWKRCLKQIKCLKLPYDSLEGCPYIYGNINETDDVTSEHGYFD